MIKQPQTLTVAAAVRIAAAAMKVAGTCAGGVASADTVMLRFRFHIFRFGWR